MNENLELLVVFLCIMLVFNHFKKDEKYLQAFFLLMGSWLAMICISETVIVFPIFALGFNVLINVMLIVNTFLREKNAKQHKW